MLDDGTPVYHQGSPQNKHLFDQDEIHVASWFGDDPTDEARFVGPFYYGARADDCVYGAGNPLNR